MRKYKAAIICALTFFVASEARASVPMSVSMSVSDNACARPIAAFRLTSPHALAPDFIADFASQTLPECYDRSASLRLTERLTDQLATQLLANQLAFNAIDVQAPDDKGVLQITIRDEASAANFINEFRPLRPGASDLSVSRIIGTAQEGEAVSVYIALSGAQARDLALDLKIEWLRDGVAIQGANQVDYRLTPEDVGAVIGAQIYAYDENGRLLDAKRVTMQMPVEGIERLPFIENLRIAGQPKVGQKLSADYQFQDPNPDDAEGETEIIWLRDNKKISGAMGRDYQLTLDDIGKQISVRVRPKSDDGLAGYATSFVLPRKVEGATELAETLPRPGAPAKIPAKIIAEGLKLRAGDTDRLAGFSDIDSGIITPAEFDVILSDKKGKVINRDLLRDILDQINALYLDKGFELSRALVPQQEMRNGILKLQLVEARIGALEVIEPGRLDPNFIIESLGLAPGDWVSLKQLETSLRRYNATNKSKISTQVAAGSEFGETDVFVKVQEPDFVEWPSLRADNYASDVAGFNQQSLNITFNNLFHRDDETSFNYLNSDGTESMSFSFSLPVNTHGTNLAISGTKSNTRFVEDGPGASGTVGTRGNSYARALSLSHPLYFDDKFALFGSFGYAYSYSDVTLINAQEKLTENRITKLSVSLPASYESEKFKATLTPSYNVLETSAKSEVFGVLNEDWLQVYKLETSLSRYLNKYLTASFRADGAYTSDKRSLNFPTEVITIGGPRSVRAYQPGASSGMKGYLLSLELRSELGNWGWVTLPEWMPSVQPYVFYDYAYAQSRADIKDRQDYWSGVGVGLTIPVIAEYLSFDMYHAWALDNNVHEAQKKAAKEEPIKFSLVARIKFNQNKDEE